jgi:site-specific DNA-methyltransferase (adenine-specific)
MQKKLDFMKVIRDESEFIKTANPLSDSEITPYLTATHGILFDIDCLKLLSHTQDEVVDSVFADPPFNLGKNYGSGFSDRFLKSEYMDWCELWISECSRVLKPGGAFFVYALPEHAYKLAQMMERTLSFRHWIALTMKGTFPRGRKLYPAHYALLYFAKGIPKTFNHHRIPVKKCRHCGKDVKDYGGHRKYLNPQGLNLTDFWEDTSPNRHKNSKFRAGINELKLMIPERAILISTNPGDIIFDPFGGGGSTYEAAQQHDRLWIGAEICTADAIANRLRDRFPQTVGHPTKLPLTKIFDFQITQKPKLFKTE